MRILITGASGFVGRHAAREFHRGGHEVIATDRAFKSPVPDADRSVEVELRDGAGLERAIAGIAPDACLHLAGISSVAACAGDPELAFAVNVAGTINLLEALKKSAPATRFLFVSTAQVYGTADGKTSISEDFPLRPASVYAVTKVAGDLAVLGWARQFGMPLMVARPNNHIGPGQTVDFVVPALASQLKKIAKGGTATVDVGNMDSVRDFTDVRDVVRAYRLILEKGSGGCAYNISSRRLMKIGVVLDKLAAMLGVTPRIEVSPVKYRPTDTSPLLDTSAIRRDTGWEPCMPIDQTLADIAAEV